jgi:hypothetical protein
MPGARCRRCSLAAKWSNPASSDRGPRVSYWAACGLYVMKATLAIHATSWVLTILLVINWWSHASKSHLSKSHHLFYILNISPSNLGCICFHGLGWMKMDEMKSSNCLWCLIEKRSSASRMSVIESGISSSSKKSWMGYPSPLTLLVVTYEDVITSVIPSIKYETGWVYPSFSSLKSNTR